MVSCPQLAHASRWPPRAAVRQRAMASSTLRCGQGKEALYRCRKLSPATRMTSATSKGGRLIASCPPLLREVRSVPAG